MAQLDEDPLCKQVAQQDNADTANGDTNDTEKAGADGASTDNIGSEKSSDKIN
jgi:hypothetical protein